MPSLFRRKSNLVEVTVESAAETARTQETWPKREKAYTPSKRELGVQTPKRSGPPRRVGGQQTPTSRKELRERRRTERAEISAGMRAGDERYLMARDKGPERALVRDIVDSRRTVGTWFFGGALIVLIGSSAAMPPGVQLISNLLWALLAVGVVVDGVLISRRVKKLIRERFPRTDQRLGSLYLYANMRAITFRRMRMPKPRVDIGDKV